MRLLRALGASFLKGFFLILPVLIAYMMVGQLFELLLVLTVPIMDILPGSLFTDEWDERVSAALLLIAIFVFAGLIAETGPARRFGRWIEHSVLDRFPPYSVLKSLSQRIGGTDEGGLQPALLTVAPGTRMVVAIIEELPDDQLTVFVPLAPTPALGMLQIVSSANVERLESSMTEALGWVLNWGTGTEAVLKPRGAPVRTD
jgi:uncharacterized membrane protein